MKILIGGKEFEVKGEELSKAITDGNESFKISSEGFSIRTTDEDATYKTNIEKDAHGTGIEIGRKNILKSIGIETEGGIHKSDESSLKALNSFIEGKVSTSLLDAKIEPDKKVKGLTDDIGVLKGTIASLTKQNENSVLEFSNFKKGITLRTAMEKGIPEGTILPKEDMVGIIGNHIKLGLSDDNQPYLIGHDGQPIKNELAGFKSVKDGVADFLKENPQYMKPTTGGGAGVDSVPAGTKQTLDDFIAEQTKAGNPANSPEFQKEYDIRSKAGLLET